MSTSRVRASLSVLLSAGALMASLAACGNASTREPTERERANADSAQVQIDALYAGTYRPPLSTGPRAVRGKRVFMVNVGAQAPTGALVVEEAQAAAEVLGWDLTVYDANFDTSRYQAGIRRAIASGADVIWNFAIDCPVAATAFREAKLAGVPVVSQEAADCSDTRPTAQDYFAENLQYVEGSFLDWAKALGAAQAAWLIAETEGQAKVVEVAVPDLIITAAVHDGFTERLAECATCELLQVLQISAADLGPTLERKIEQAIARNPQANGLAVAYDDLMTGGGASAVRDSGRSDQLEVVAGTGFVGNIQLIAEDDGQDAGFGVDYGYETWATADLINRFLAGEEGVPSGVGIQVYDRDHSLPAGAYVSPVKYFREKYTAIWNPRS